MPSAPRCESHPVSAREAVPQSRYGAADILMMF